MGKKFRSDYDDDWHDSERQAHARKDHKRDRRAEQRRVRSEEQDLLADMVPAEWR